MAVFRAVYTSRPFGFDDAILSSILENAQRLNARDGVTGALICRSDMYLQLLEGSEIHVMNTLKRIKQDDRHIELTLHVAESAAERMFGRWAMLHDPATSWIWSQQDVSAGAVQRATPEEIMAFFIKLQGLHDKKTVE